MKFTRREFGGLAVGAIAGGLVSEAAQGAAAVPAMPPGAYLVKAELQGFRTAQNSWYKSDVGRSGLRWTVVGAATVGLVIGIVLVLKKGKERSTVRGQRSKARCKVRRGVTCRPCRRVMV